ncbi:MAG: hypothetical protein KF805_13730 [Phycisphaeraceae bacterium]|nr:hypothetical protein [Phycisphaeraceae bacterium]
MTPTAASNPSTIPSGLRAAIAVLSALIIASSVATIGASFFAEGRPPWALMGFELLTIMAGAFGLATARGRFADGPGLALACVAGTVLAASIFGYLGTTGQIGDWKLHTWLIARATTAALVGLLAAWVVLRRTPGAWLLALRGTVYTAAAIGFVGLLALFDGEIRPSGSTSRFVSHAALSVAAIGAIPICILFAILTLARNSGADEAVPKWMRLLGQLSLPIVAGLLLLVTQGHMTTTLTGGAEIARISLLCALGIVLTGLLCAGVHIIVQAFASCSLPQNDAPLVTPTQGATSS